MEGLKKMEKKNSSSTHPLIEGVSQRHLDLYLQKAEEHKFKPEDVGTVEGQREAMRYLLVNGLIPATPENLKTVGDKEFYMEASLLPKETVKKIYDDTMSKEDKWEFDEEYEDEELRVISTDIEGIWIKDGKPTGAKIQRKREVRVTTFFVV